MYYIYTENGLQETDPETWATFLEKHRVVKQESVGEYWVSTIFLGLDHSFLGDEPLIFESMIFGDGLPLDQEMRRYGTYEEALEGHEEICRRLNEEA